MSQESHSDPLEFVRNMWGNMGFSLPGMVTPTVDVDELDKRITDMKAVEGWLKMNLNMLQMSIQGLEMQHATLSTLRQMGDIVRAPSEPAGDAPANPFAGWSWMNPPGANAPEATDATAEDEAARDAATDAAAKAANAFADAAAAATNAAASAAMWPWQLMGEHSAKETPPKATPKRAAAKRRAPAAKKKAASTPATTKKPAAKPAARKKAPSTRTRSTAASKKA